MPCEMSARCLSPVCRGFTAALALSAVCGSSSFARAEPLRLRADALADARAPAGLLVLQGEDKARPWLDVEALVWTGAGAMRDTGATGDVSVLMLRLREPHGYGEVRAGRFVVATGAIRPVHLDGASVLARSPSGTTFEAFAGVPVAPRFSSSPYQSASGVRVAQGVASTAALGVSYSQRNTRHGGVAQEEVGADFAAVPVRWIDLAAKAAYDIVNPGVAEASLSSAMRVGDVRAELFASHRSPGRLLPATSLFSVLGDFPSQSVGSTLRWHAAPRLDLLGSGAVQRAGGELGMNAWLRSTLRLDDRGDGSIGAEVRRQQVAAARWTGVRTTFTRSLVGALRCATEVELAVPDEPDGRGAAWPWALLALSWRRGGWEVAAAVEGAATPEHRYETNALARVSRVFGSDR